MRGVALMLALAACPPRPNPPVPPADMAAPIPVCAPGPNVTPSNVCTGIYTVEGLACASCPDGHGCIDTVDVIYCVEGSCIADPRCTPRWR